MESLAGYILALNEGRLDPVLAELYGRKGIAEGRERCGNLLRRMERWEHSGPAVLVSTPGRTEIGGNHTDHNHGVVLAAAVHFDCLAVACPVEGTTIRLRSEGFSGVIEVDIADLTVRPEEKGTSAALVRGVAAGLVEAGYSIKAFDACVSGTVPVGSGLSSSAAFEVCIGQIFNQLANNGSVRPIELARIGRQAENIFFSKPCGLMDQATCAVQGILSIDFGNPEAPSVMPLDVTFSGSGYQMVVVNTGGDHADLTPDYAAIPDEMSRAAGVFGQDFARGITVEQVLAKVAQIREAAGDRGVLRLLHFIEESDRAVREAELLKQGDLEGFLAEVRASGDSSWRLLQNCVSARTPLSQPIPLALSVSERLLGGRGAWRVHGGGFAGTIQVFVPEDMLSQYVSVMESICGVGSVVPLRVRKPGNELLMPVPKGEA